MSRLLPIVAIAGGFVLMAVALDQGAGISLGYGWGIAFGAGFALAVAGLSDRI